MSKIIKIIDYPLSVGQSFYNTDIVEQIKADLANKNTSENYLYLARVISKSDNGVLFIDGENEIEILKSQSFSLKDSEKFYSAGAVFDFDKAIDLVELNEPLSQYGLTENDLMEITYYFLHDIVGQTFPKEVRVENGWVFIKGTYGDYPDSVFVVPEYPNFKFKYYNELSEFSDNSYIMIMTPKNELLKFLFYTYNY